MHIQPDGSIPQIEITSCGLNRRPLPAKGTYQTYIACHLTEKDRTRVGHVVEPGPGQRMPELPREMPYITEEENEAWEKGLKPYIANLREGAAAGFKYFGFQGDEAEIALELRGTGTVQVLMDSADGIAAAELCHSSLVIDIDNNWRNPITNTRTYGSDPRRVAAMGEAYVKELQKHGVAASIKHFPGDGVDERDQHLVTSVNSLSVEEWEATYGEAYRRCIDAGALTLMAGYIMQPAMTRKYNPGIRDEELMPGPLQKELLQDVLRGQLGFNGMIITDSSGMAGFGCAMARSKAIPACVNAGCDMILFTKNMEEDLMFLRSGIESGEVPLERIDDAVTRILALKAALRLPDKKAAGTLVPSLERAEQVVGSTEHLAVAREVADRAITLVKEEKGLFPITPERYPRVYVYPKEAGATDLAFGAASRVDQVVDRLRAEGFKVDVFKPSPGFEGLSAPMSSVIDNYDLLIYVANYATKSNQTVVRLEWAQPMGADCPIFIHDVPTVFISLENPYHLADVPRVRTYINTYGSSDQTLDALMDKLTGRSAFQGKSPVDAFCGFWDAHL